MKTENSNLIGKRRVYKPLQFHNCGAFAPKAKHDIAELVPLLKLHQTPIWSYSRKYCLFEVIC